MKIAFVRSGIRVRDIELIEKLVERGFKVSVITSEALDVNCERVHISFVKSGSINMLLEMLRALKSLNIDLVIGLFSSYMMPYVAFLGKSLRKPALHYVTAHPRTIMDLKLLSPREIKIIFSSPYWLRELIFSFPFASRLLLRASNSVWIKKIVVPSYRMMYEFEALGVSREKLHVVPSGIDLGIFNPKLVNSYDKKDLFGTDQVKLVLYLGYASTLRGTDVLVKSFSILSSKLPEVRLLMLLYEEKEARDSVYLRKLLERYNIKEKVLVLYGYRSRVEIAQFLKTADIVALPFKFSGFVIESPLTVLEAMAMNKTVVTTNVNAVSEIIDHYDQASIVKRGDPIQFAGAMEEALRTALTNQKSASIPMHNFDLNIVTSKLANLISEDVNVT